MGRHTVTWQLFLTSFSTLLKGAAIGYKNHDMSTKKKNKTKHAPRPARIASSAPPVVIQTAPRRDGFSIAQWRLAMKQAESVDYPSRTLLYDLYNDILLDTHLESVIGKRRDNIEAMKILFNTGCRERNERIEALITSEWFPEMCKDIFDARLFGHSAMWLDLSGGEFHKYELLPRKHIVPERHIHLLRQTDRHGTDYTQPPYSYYIIEAGKSNDLGLLLKLAPWVLFKRGDISDWATFNEMFSMPFRLGKYPQYDNEAKRALAEACRDSASMAWAIVPNTTDLSFIKTEASGNTVAYREFGEFCDKQMSKAVVRNTLTTDAEGGEYKGEVHQDSEKGVFAADRRYVLAVLNTQFKRLLQLHGFEPGNGKFSCVEEDHICLKDRISIDMQASQKIVIPAEYWYEKYGYPIPEGGPQTIETSFASELSAVRAELEASRREARMLADNLPINTTAKPHRRFFR